MNELSAGLASRPDRLKGAILDGIVTMPLMALTMWATGIWGQILSDEPLGLTQLISLHLFGWLLFLLLHGYLLATRGQTIGKYLVKTRMVDQDGNIPSFWKMFVLRYIVLGLVGYIPLIGHFVGQWMHYVDSLWIFGNKERRCLHDYLAGTRVIKIRELDLPPVV